MPRFLRGLARILMPWHDPDREAAATARLEHKLNEADQVADRLWFLEASPRVDRLAALRASSREAGRRLTR